MRSNSASSTGVQAFLHEDADGLPSDNFLFRNQRNGFFGSLDFGLAVVLLAPPDHLGLLLDPAQEVFSTLLNSAASSSCSLPAPCPGPVLQGPELLPPAALLPLPRDAAATTYRSIPPAT